MKGPQVNDRVSLGGVIPCHQNFWSWPDCILHQVKPCCTSAVMQGPRLAHGASRLSLLCFEHLACPSHRAKHVETTSSLTPHSRLLRWAVIRPFLEGEVTCSCNMLKWRRQSMRPQPLLPASALSSPRKMTLALPELQEGRLAELIFCGWRFPVLVRF